MIIGCGGVASVAIAKCCQNSDVFTEIIKFISCNKRGDIENRNV